MAAMRARLVDDFERNAQCPPNAIAEDVAVARLADRGRRDRTYVAHGIAIDEPPEHLEDGQCRIGRLCADGARRECVATKKNSSGRLLDDPHMTLRSDFPDEGP